MKGVNWEVGSTWYADDYKYSTEAPRCLSWLGCHGDMTLLSTCRSAISYILYNNRKGRRALVPAFTCHSVISPFVDAGYEVFGYPLKENLSIDVDGLAALVGNVHPDVILVHGYFGFDTIGNAAEYLEWCRSQGIIVIEDMTQTMFSTFGRPESDYIVGSIRKWLPVPDGAFLSGFKITGLSEDIQLSEAKIDAMRSKNQYIIYGKGTKETFMPKFFEAERILDSRFGPYAISGYTLPMLKDIDLQAFAAKRKHNFNYLATRLHSHPEISLIFSRATDDVVPFQLPVFISDGRSDFQKYMASHNVYPTIIWKCPEELEKETNAAMRMIYDRILCFHIDQRYDEDDMDKIADIIDSYFER